MIAVTEDSHAAAYVHGHFIGVEFAAKHAIDAQTDQLFVHIKKAHAVAVVQLDLGVHFKVVGAHLADFA